jgi:hypothetical protein
LDSSSHELLLLLRATLRFPDVLEALGFEGCSGAFLGCFRAAGASDAALELEALPAL